MTKSLTRVALVVLTLFAALLVNVNVIQVVQAESYAERDANRQLARDFSVRRGAIRAADGTDIARVQETPDQLRFLRVYDGGPLFAHVTGFLSPVFGKTELEESADEALSGAGNAIDTFADLIANREPVGDTVVSTIVPEVQEAARSALGDRRGAVVALDPASGEVLALWSFPSYDPNLLTANTPETRAAWDALQADPARPLSNRATSELFAPGSTFKLVTAAAALENGLDPNTQFPDPRSLDLPGTDALIPNFGGSLCNGGQPLNLFDAIRVSCNTAFGQLGIDVGGVALATQAERFGFTTTLGGQMPRVAPSQITTPELPPEQIDAATAAQTAIGQRDVVATPLQMAAVTAAIGADGILYAPRLVSRHVDAADSELRRFEPAQVSQAVSPATAAILTEAMIGVVARGTGRQAQIPGVEVAGKTGTAQRGEGQNPNVWFVGFAPAQDPRVAVAVLVEDGGGVGSEATGGQLAAPIARAVLQAGLARP